MRRHNKTMPIVIVGNKSDLVEQRKVNKADAEQLAKELKCPFFEASARDRHNVEEAFFEVVREMRRLRPVVKDKPTAVKAKKACTIL